MRSLTMNNRRLDAGASPTSSPRGLRGRAPLLPVGGVMPKGQRSRAGGKSTHLEGAELSDADVAGADLHGAYLDRTKLSGMKGHRSARHGSPDSGKTLQR